MKPKLVVCDIDNTLVPKHKHLTSRAKQAIDRLVEQGTLFGLASGRSVEQLHLLEDQWQIHCELLIGLNGSELYDDFSKKTEQFYIMEPEWIKECIELMAPFDTSPRLSREGISYARPNDPSIASSQAYLKQRHTVHLVKDDSEFWAGPAFKVGFHVKAEDMPAIEKRVAEHPSKNYIGFKTENTMFEFCHAKASKGELLKLFCQRNAIDLQEVVAFGDMTNDISLLEAAGTGVCMLNGSEDTKQAADVITEKSVEDEGWAEYVEQHLL